MKTLLFGATIVNDDRQTKADITIENGTITDISDTAHTPRSSYDETVDATGCLILPGVIDTHVHFREPGMTAKADIESESRAAAYGGVTSYFDMPNTVPQTTTPEALDKKIALAHDKSHVNYAFFYGATNDNADTFQRLDPTLVPGIKLFMGSSTGNMLVDRQASLDRIFATAGLPVVAHCEDTAGINRNMARIKQEQGDDPDVSFHPLIRSEQACYASTSLAVSLAKKHGARLHVAHLTTARELQLFEKTTDEQMREGRFNSITAEAVIAHLMFCDDDYARLGTRIKCNPAIKSRHDRDELRRALTDGRITTVGTDHAPHQLSDKQGGCARAASGMPMLQFSLVSMLELADEGVLPVERVVRLMCHNPALLFGVRDRGFIRKGCKADITVVRRSEPWTVTEDVIQSKCKWSPMTGHTFNWHVEHTFCNGAHIYNKGVFDIRCRGEEIRFR